MAPIPIWATTLMVQNETIHKYIYEIKKNFFQIQIDILLSSYIMHIYYVYMHCIYYIMLYIKYMYIFQGFPYRGIVGNPPTSQTFAHSPRSWNNFFPHQRLVPSSLKKNFQVINQ